MSMPFSTELLSIDWVTSVFCVCGNVSNDIPTPLPQWSKTCTLFDIVEKACKHTHTHTHTHTQHQDVSDEVRQTYSRTVLYCLPALNTSKCKHNVTCSHPNERCTKAQHTPSAKSTRLLLTARTNTFFIGL